MFICFVSEKHCPTSGSTHLYLNLHHFRVFFGLELSLWPSLIEVSRRSGCDFCMIPFWHCSCSAGKYTQSDLANMRYWEKCLGSFLQNNFSTAPSCRTPHLPQTVMSVKAFPQLSPQTLLLYFNIPHTHLPEQLCFYPAVTHNSSCISIILTFVLVCTLQFKITTEGLLLFICTAVHRTSHCRLQIKSRSLSLSDH